ncbi:MAG: hypothetical protein ABFE07_07505 [Armatimonadia bacterium]
MNRSNSRARSIHPPAATRRPAPAPRLFPRLLPIFILGAMAILHILSLARLSELECESRRLDRLILEQKTMEAELLREHRALVSNARLTTYAQSKGMVAPESVKTLQVGLLPSPQVYWQLPEEPGRERLGEGLQLGALSAAEPRELP